MGRTTTCIPQDVQALAQRSNICSTIPVDGNSGDELLKGTTALLSEHEKSKTEGSSVEFESVIMSDPDYWMLAAGIIFFSCVFLIVAIRIHAAHCRVMERAARDGRNRRLSYLRSLGRMAWELSLYNRGGLEVQPRPEKLISGLGSSEIETLPTFIFKQGSPKLDTLIQCCVCLEELKEGEKGRTLPTCGHCFHAECVDMWLFTHTTCPLCRKKAGSSLASKLLTKSPDSTINGNIAQISDQGHASSSEAYFDLEIGENSGDPQSSETASRHIEEDRRSVVLQSPRDRKSSPDGIVDGSPIHQV